jgi:hypothetical protein
MGQTASTPAAAAAAATAQRPIDHAKPAAPARCPVDHASASTPAPAAPSAPAKCPVDHAGAGASGAPNPANNIPELAQAPAAHQTAPLPTERETSSIPRDTGGARWEYPSPQQFYNALVRKGWETPEESVEVMVHIHNFLNERAWQEVCRWEADAEGCVLSDGVRMSVLTLTWRVQAPGPAAHPPSRPPGRALAQGAHAHARRLVAAHPLRRRAAVRPPRLDCAPSHIRRRGTCAPSFSRPQLRLASRLRLARSTRTLVRLRVLWARVCPAIRAVTVLTFCLVGSLRHRLLLRTAAAGRLARLLARRPARTRFTLECRYARATRVGRVERRGRRPRMRPGGRRREV